MTRERAAGNPASWRLVGRLILHRPRLFVLCLVFGILFFGSPLIEGLLLRAFFDTISRGRAIGLDVVGVLLAFLVLQIAQMASGIGLSAAWGGLLFTTMALVRRNLFAAMFGGDGVRALSVSPGDAVSRFRDDAETVADSIDAWIDLVGRVLFAAVALYVMLSIDAGLTITVMSPFLIVVALVARLGWRTEELRRASRAAVGRVTGFLGELFSAALAIKVAGAAPFAIAQLERLGEGRRRAGLRDHLFEHAIDAFSANVVHLAIGGVLLLSVESMRRGTFTVGDFILFVTYLEQLVWLPDEIVRWLRGNRQSAVSFDRMRRTVGRDESTWLPTAALVVDDSSPGFPLPAQRTSAPPRTSPLPLGVGLGEGVQRHHTPILEARDLTCLHPDGGGIDGATLSLLPGTLTVVTGRVASGKTSLLLAILGLLPRQRGQVLWRGEPIEAPLAPPRAAFTPQTPRLFSESVRDNILQGDEPDARDLAAAIATAVLDVDLPSLDHGLDTLVGPRGIRLSGGQVQRVAAARMLVREPELLVMDDLSSALDVETEAILWERLAHLKGRTCLAVSHRRAALSRADQVIVLKEGAILDSGRLDELLERCDEMRALWNAEPDAEPQPARPASV